jgi:hypothetical protein
LLDHARQVGQVIALDFDQTQARLGVLGQQGANQRGFTGTARAPEQCVVGRHAVKELLGVAPQLLHLTIDADQVGQAHVETDFQRQQKPLRPSRCQRAPGSESSRWHAEGWATGLDTRQNGIGAFKKSIQSGIHVFSSGTFTVMMAIQRRNMVVDERLALVQGLARHIGIHA